MGRKEISQLTFFNFVSAISIGAIAAAATKGDLNIGASPNQLIDPLSTELVSDGKVNKTNLTKLNLTVEWLNEQLKSHGID